MDRVWLTNLRLILSAALLTSGDCHAFQASSDRGQSRLLNVSCDQAETVIAGFLKERGIRLYPIKSQPHSYSLMTRQIQDAEGTRLSAERVSQYFGLTGVNAARGIPLGMRFAGFWTFQHPYTLFGRVATSPAPSGCRCQLLFQLGQGAGLVWLVVPIDGDSWWSESDGQLERQYLDGIERRLTSRSAQPSTSPP